MSSLVDVYVRREALPDGAWVLRAIVVEAGDAAPDGATLATSSVTRDEVLSAIGEIGRDIGIAVVHDLPERGQ